MYSIMIAFREDDPPDTTPGDPSSCLELVRGALPIALARPFVEQFVPEGTRVSIICNIVAIIIIMTCEVS